MAKKFMKEIKILLLENKRVINGYDYATKHGVEITLSLYRNVEKIRVYNTYEETEETFIPSEYINHEKAAQRLLRDYLPSYMEAELHMHTGNKYFPL